MDRNIHVFLFFLFYGGEFHNTDYFPENGIFSPSKLFPLHYHGLEPIY